MKFYGKGKSFSTASLVFNSDDDLPVYEFLKLHFKPLATKAVLSHILEGLMQREETKGNKLAIAILKDLEAKNYEEKDTIGGMIKFEYPTYQGKSVV